MREGYSETPVGVEAVLGLVLPTCTAYLCRAF